MNSKRMTKEQRDQAKVLFRSGQSLAEIAKFLDFTVPSIRRVVDEAYAAKRRAQINSARHSPTKSALHDSAPERVHPDRLATKLDAEARLAEIPDDTRNFTAQMFGDPIPGDPRRPWRKEALRT